MLGIFLDTETSGLNPRSQHILEIAFRILNMRTGKEIASYQSIICQSEEIWQAANPDSLKINGFTHEKLKSGQLPADASEQIMTLFKTHAIHRGKAVYICQNPSFDRAFFSQLIDIDTQEKLGWPYHWLDLASMHWAKSPTPWKTGLSKDTIAELYGLPPEAKPHTAMNGVDHLLACYKAIVGFSPKTLQ